MVREEESAIRFRSPSELEPHPLNDDVYGDRTNIGDSLLSSVQEHGILSPVVIDTGADTDSPVIISGHRRVEAAKRAGLDQIPVRPIELDSDLERQERLLLYNQYREKTFSQMMREAEELERIERERAQRRQGARTDIVENSSRGDGYQNDSDFGKTREKVGEMLGMSGRTYDKAKRVWETAKSGDTVAKHEVSRLDRDNQSIHGAHEKVRERVENDDSVGNQEETTESSTEAERADSDDTDERTQLTPDEVTLSAHTGTNDDVFPEILDLHVEPGASVADVTYGEGVFWRQVPSSKYDLTATDIAPERSPDSEQGVDCRNLPYDDDSFDCVVLDPPYAEGFYADEDKPSENEFWIEDRYVGGMGDSPATYHEAVLEMYAAAGSEAQRVLHEGGTLIAKMQDEVSRNEQRLTHIEVTNHYEEMGFHARDLFVVVRPDTPTIGRMYEQRRARKNHSYFIVFEA